MKQWWRQKAERINALSLRERVFLCLALIVCCLALADTLWLSPAQVAHKQATQRFASQNTDLQRLRNELRTVAQPVDASQALRDELQSLQQQLDAVNADIRTVAPQAEGGAELEQVLVQFLRRHDGLTLVATGTAAAASTSANTPPGLSRRGLELRVAGPYATLVRYVQTLETALPTLRWGPLQLKATPPAPPELTLHVYVLGVNP